MMYSKVLLLLALLGCVFTSSETEERAPIALDVPKVEEKEQATSIVNEDLDDDEFMLRDEERNLYPEPLNDPLTNGDFENSISTALSGYDVVIGAPLNVIQNGASNDPGSKDLIFMYDPSDRYSKVTVKVATGCSENTKSEIISTVDKFREQVDQSVSVSGSAEGGAAGVKVGFEFSASRTSSEVVEQIRNKKGALALFTMTCNARNVRVGSKSTGYPKFSSKFKSMVNYLASRNPNSEAEKEDGFKELIREFGTHFLAESTLGARVTRTSFLTEKATQSMSSKQLETCASASVSASYLGNSASVSASGCKGKDGETFESRKNIVDHVVRSSYGTYWKSGGKNPFSGKDISDPMPIKFKLRLITELFEPRALTDNNFNQATSQKILGWLKPMFNDLPKYYCKVFKQEAPNCGQFLQKGCGFSDNCGLGKGCIDTDKAQGKFKCVPKCVWDNGKGVGKGAIKVGDQTGYDCVEACIKKSERTNINGVRVYKNGNPGCWCERGMLKSAGKGITVERRWTYKSCIFKVPYVTVSMWTSKTIGYWGDWAKNEECPPGQYVNGFRLKSEGHVGRGDDTALNGVALICSDNSIVTSKVGPYGTWGSPLKCNDYVPVNGFQIQIEGHQGDGDDTAANNVNLKCQDGNKLAGNAKTNWGTWSNWVMCPAGKVAIGIQVRMEPGTSDDTTLNGMKLLCREVVANPGPYTVSMYSHQTIGNFGNWGNAEKCAEGRYARGFRLKSEAPDGDDTALNAVQLVCSDGLAVTSSVGPYGKWMPTKDCGREPIVAFKIQIEKRQGDGDDTGANNVHMMCNGGKILHGNAQTNWGDWSDWVRCPSGKVAIGIQTKVESNQGRGDDTTLNGMKLICGEVPRS